MSYREIVHDRYKVIFEEPEIYVNNEARKRSGHMTHAMVRFAPDAYINFNKETKPGDTIRLYRLCGPADCLVEGRDPDGKSCFVVKLVF